MRQNRPGDNTDKQKKQTDNADSETNSQGTKTDKQKGL